MGILQLHSLSISSLLKFINASVKRFHFVLLLHEFRSRFSEQVICIPIEKRFSNTCRVRESEERFVVVMSSGQIRPCRKMCLVSTDSGLKTLRQVSLFLSDLEMNWTSSLLVPSDKLAIVLHLLHAPVGTVAKPTEHEVAHRRSPIPGTVSRCFPLNRRLTL